MSLPWGSGAQGLPFNRQDSNQRLRLHNYQGPYDTAGLKRARDSLLSYVDRVQNSKVWRNINSKTNIYGYMYCDSTCDGYGESSSTFSHAGMPGQSNVDFEDDMPSTSTDFASDTFSAMNDFSVAKEMNVDTEEDNIVKVKHWRFADSSNSLDSESNAVIGGKSTVSVQKNSMVLDGHSPLKDFSVTRLINKDVATENVEQEHNVTELFNLADVGGIENGKKFEKATNLTKDTSVRTKECSNAKIASKSMEKDGAVDNVMIATVETSATSIDLTNDSLEETGPIMIEDDDEDDILNAEGNAEDDDDVILTQVSFNRGPKVKNFDAKATEHKTRSGKEYNNASSVDVSTEINIEPEDEKEYIDASSLQKMFQCEFCQTVTENAPEMMSHLREELHHSASSVFATSDKTVVYLDKATSLKFQDAVFQKIVATCPAINCYRLFTDPYACADHTLTGHAQERFGGYSLADVIDREPVQVSSVDNNCQVCGFKGKKMKFLRQHYVETNHQPYVIRPNYDMYTACSYCSSTFLNYERAIRHVRKHTNMIIDGKLNLLVLTLSKEKRMVEFPPYTRDKQGEHNYLSAQIRISRQYKKIRGKSGRKKSNQKIRKLKGLLKIVNA